MTLYMYPGSWNPLHAGHLSIAQYVDKKYIEQKDKIIAENHYLVFELCVTPFDKPKLEEAEIKRRCQQFSVIGRNVEVTNCTSYLQKSINVPLYIQYSRPGDTKYFITGYDTAKRIDAPKYYYDSIAERDRCLDLISDSRWKFLVFPRNGKLKEDLSEKMTKMCIFEEDFIENPISSTEIRNKEDLQLPLSCLCIGDYFEYNGNIYSHEGYNDDGYAVATINGEEFFDIGLNTPVIRKYKK